jgi:hypothetical protein
MNGELIASVHNQPFTYEFDSRDFGNGFHELSARVLTDPGTMEYTSVPLHLLDQKKPGTMGGPSSN